MKININEITIKVKLFENNQNQKAIVTLDLGDLIIKGYRVQPSKHKNYKGDDLWITPPSYRDGGGRYHPIVYMEDKGLWKELEMEIWKAYYQAMDEHLVDTYGEEARGLTSW